MSDTNLAFEIRLATIKDLDALTELHMKSFTPDEHVPVALGRRYVYATYRWQVSGKQAYTLVAEKDAKIIGLVAVCDGPFTKPMFMACLPEFFGAIFRKPSLLTNKKLWQRLFRRPNVSQSSKGIADRPGFAQITFVAVDASMRGLGVFPALVEATKTYSAQRGSRAIRVGVYKWNAPSRKAFIKANWIETSELETQDTVFYVTYLDPTFESEIICASSQ